MRPIFSDPWGSVERIALEVMECSPGQRDEFIRKSGRVFLAVALFNGCSEKAAANFAKLMQQLIGEVISDIELRGGSKTGSA
jgi:hypothetical protein